MRQPEVVLLCGVAGAGKTAYARALEKQGYVRLSVDQEIWNRFGRYGVDYPADRYDEYTAVARDAVRQKMLALIAEGRDTVVDSSFWQRARREEYRRIIENAGARRRLVHLRADPGLLRARLRLRSHRCDADAFPVSDELLTHYLACFEPPSGEGEEVIDAVP